MSLQKNTLLNKSIISNTTKRYTNIRYPFNLYAIVSLFLIIFSLPMFSEDSPVYFRLKPDAQYLTLTWEKNLFSENFSAEQKIRDGDWDTVPGLNKKVKVAVVLAGGVVRGIAHIGVLRALEQNYIPIDGLSGTSIGSIVGGLYASGYSPDSLESIVKKDIDWKTFFQDQQKRTYTPIWERLQNKPRPPAMEVGLTWKPLFISYNPGKGIRTAQKFTDEIADKTLAACYKAGFDFSELPHPFGAMVVNLNSGESELRVKGTVSTAVRASASVPVAFEPMIIEGKEYIDGGILDNLPVDAFLQDFDTLRNPDNIINIHNEEKGEKIYVISSYPSERRKTKDKAPELEEEMFGLVGIGVLNKSSCFSREFHVWNSWNHSNGQIDIDVTGGFDFNEEKLEELINKGYNTAMGRIYKIKEELIEMESGSDSPVEDIEIFEVGSVKFYYVNDNDTLIVDSSKGKKARKAAKLVERSYIEKKDVCYAIRNIYTTGDYENVGAKINKSNEKINVEFFLSNKEEHLDSVEVRLIMSKKNPSDSATRRDSIAIADSAAITKKIKSEMIKKGRKLGYHELKEITEREYVNRWYISPLVVYAEYLYLEGKDILLIRGNKGTKLKGVKIVIPGSSKDTSNQKAEQEKESSNLDVVLEKVFKDSLSPKGILGVSKRIYEDYQLRTISVEGVTTDSLLSIRVRPKTGHTLEFPALSFDKDQGINLFTELRTKRIRGLGDRSFYANLGQNFPVKAARELPQGHSWNIGFNKYSPAGISWGAFIPDFSIGSRSLLYPGLPDTNHYDMQYKELFSGNLSWPIYISNGNIFFNKKADFAFIPGVESCSKISLNGISEGDSLERPFNLFLRFGYDELDRGVFPSTGSKGSFETVYDLNRNAWKLKIKETFVWGFRIQKKVKTILTGEAYGSFHQEETAFWERYSMGGITPVGSYQLRLYDFEDLPGYSRNEFIEPCMFKLGGSVRFTLVEMEVLGLRANLYFLNSLYWAGASGSWASMLDEGANFFAQNMGIHLDTSILNIGLGWSNTTGNLIKDLNLSVVLYGIGL
jgi:predicted acylesterase/phospholipase RssA